MKTIHKIVNCLFMIALSIGLFNCKGEQPKNESNSSDSIRTESNVKEINEDFSDFFISFKTDSLFQKSRIKFPLVILSYADEVDESKYVVGDNLYKKTLITSQEWSYESFYWDESYAKEQMEAYTQEIKTENDTTKIFWNGVNNGINIELIFARNKGEWYYLKMIDSSF